jgi:uncharacterized protein
MAEYKLTESGFTRNNLDKSSSPYLQQHMTNPVWWQEWSEEVIRYAADSERLLFVSVGYATCHWCHVMAAEAFSDPLTAGFLNNNFICIKVDREQRPDIDQYLMDFITDQNGSGGWPLNVFMTPDLHPVYALTYAPVSTNGPMLSLLSISEKVKKFYIDNKEVIPPFISHGNQSDTVDESFLARSLSIYFDAENGGFGSGQKFPPHSSLLYLLYKSGIVDNAAAELMCIKTLDAMQLRGLHDHLEGGIFRYCVDREWTIPHFEKMLYDQAMALWCYSLAYRLTSRDQYRITSEKILRCLDESFRTEDLYITGIDADTEHREGATYLWTYDQLKIELLPEEFEKLSTVYFIEKTGNFNGMIHLIRRSDIPLQGIEDKLLSIRRNRKQPLRDNKFLCGMNALLAIAFIQAGRCLNRPDLELKAAGLTQALIKRFWTGKSLMHSYCNGVLQDHNFLFDAAALLTSITMLYEVDDSWGNSLTEMTSYVESFKDGDKWIESLVEDFQTVYASWTDHPVPSSVSLAEMGLARAALLNGKELSSRQYLEPFKSDFYNIAAMINNGQFHLIETEKVLAWSRLPVNSIRVRGKHETDCYGGTCRPLEKQVYSK